MPATAQTTVYASEHDQLIVAKAELRVAFEREAEWAKSYKLVAKATSRQQKKIERLSDILAKIAKADGEPCPRCLTTERDITVHAKEFTVDEAVAYAESDWDDFDANYPDECEHWNCFGGFVLEVSA